MPTFAEAAVTVIEQKRGGWRSPRQAADWLRSLERHVFPGIGSRPVSDVNSADVLAVLTPVKMQTRPDPARAHSRGAGVGDRDGVPGRQPL